MMMMILLQKRNQVLWRYNYYDIGFGSYIISYNIYILATYICTLKVNRNALFYLNALIMKETVTVHCLAFKTLVCQ